MQVNKQEISFLTAENENISKQENFSKLIELMSKYAPNDGCFDLPIAGLRLIKTTRIDYDFVHSVCKTGICIVAQGAKQVILGSEVYQHERSQMVAYCAEIPIKANIIKASKEEPYLSLVIPLDRQRLTELSFKVFPDGIHKNPNTNPIYVGEVHPKIVESSIRLMELILAQEDVDLLAPLIIDEILIRLLRSTAGAVITQIGIIDSHAHRVSKAISWLKENYEESIKVEMLAEIAGMSPSSFHQHFKLVTSMSPLQYQKTLRLQEARHLMLSQMMDVSAVCMKVGYTSLSQFSREYSRFFGYPPSKDMARLREEIA